MPDFTSSHALTFMSQKTPTKTRIFRRVSETELSPVSTVVGPPDVGNALLAAMNDAAFTGDTTQLVAALATLPEPVALACRQAVDAASMREPRLVGSGGWPMSEIRHSYFTPGDPDLIAYAHAAMDVGLQLLLESRVDDDGRIEVDARLLSDDVEMSRPAAERWWRVPDYAPLVERLSSDTEEGTRRLLRDPRWRTHYARAYWIWVMDEPTPAQLRESSTSATAEWFVEFFDEELRKEGLPSFVPADDQDAATGRFLTERTRMLLWLSLLNITTDLDTLLTDWPDANSQVRDDMPELVHGQPREWWDQLDRAAARLCEAARHGGWPDLEPRTVAEEALISLATRRGYVEWARDTIDELGLEAAFKALPVTQADEIWEEVLGELTGDTDVEALWTPRLIERDPAAGTDLPNSSLHRYRADSWHRLFDRAIDRLPGVEFE